VLFVIAYDIADPKRLRRVARRMEKHAVRTQKSVFILRGSAARVRFVLDDVASLLDPRADAVQAWELSPHTAPAGLTRGIAGASQPRAAILGGPAALILKETS
jgi:CRISPR-associated protein Cas2